MNYGRKAIGKSVEDYEKKNNIKLHCAGVIPLLLWLLREYRLENGLSLTTGNASASPVSSVSGTATATTTATVASSAIVTATKTIGTALVAKIVACVLAVSVVVGGIILGVAHYKNANQSNNVTGQSKPNQSLSECNHSMQALGAFSAGIEDNNAILANAHDYLCKKCKIMNVTSDIQASDECNHIWKKTEIECPYATYTRGHCQNCNKYSILEYTLNSCEHNWTIGEEESTCSFCGYLCKHNFGYYFSYTGDFSEDGLPTGNVKAICCGCGLQMGNGNSSE